MNPKGKINLPILAVIGAISVSILAALTIASFNNPIPDQILPVNSSSELDLSAYFPEFSQNVWFSVSGTGNLSILFGSSLSEPWKFYKNPSVTIVPFKNWVGEEAIEFKAMNGTDAIKKSVIVRVVPSTSPESSVFSPLTTTTLMNLIEKASSIITEPISPAVSQSGRKIGISAPSQSGTLWKDNLSTGNLS